MQYDFNKYLNNISIIYTTMYYEKDEIISLPFDKFIETKTNKISELIKL